MLESRTWALREKGSLSCFQINQSSRRKNICLFLGRPFFFKCFISERKDLPAFLLTLEEGKNDSTISIQTMRKMQQCCFIQGEWRTQPTLQAQQKKTPPCASERNGKYSNDEMELDISQCLLQVSLKHPLPQCKLLAWPSPYSGLFP